MPSKDAIIKSPNLDALPKVDIVIKSIFAVAGDSPPPCRPI